jgi:nucleotide-binding universal stress UspA family protein
MAKEIGADVVVMATTHGAKGNFPFDCVTEKVLKSSAVPVLTIDPRTHGRS